jgi:hypothetical protein
MPGCALRGLIRASAVVHCQFPRSRRPFGTASQADPLRRRPSLLRAHRARPCWAASRSRVPQTPDESCRGAWMRRVRGGRLLAGALRTSGPAPGACGAWERGVVWRRSRARRAMRAAKSHTEDTPSGSHGSSPSPTGARLPCPAGLLQSLAGEASAPRDGRRRRVRCRPYGLPDRGRGHPRSATSRRSPGRPPRAKQEQGKAQRPRQRGQARACRRMRGAAIVPISYPFFTLGP